MHTRAILLFSVFAMAAAVGAGCGGDDLVVAGTAVPTFSLTPTPTCVSSGEACTVSADCCSGLTCQTDDNGDRVCL